LNGELILRLITLIAVILLTSCGSRPPNSTMLTKAQLAAVERNVTSCTAATGTLAPLVARGQHMDLEDAAVDARDRCSSARAEILRSVGGNRDLEVCWRDVQAQEQVSIAQLSALDTPTAEKRAALLKALNEAVALQVACGQVVARLQGPTAPN
jgi:hypothetical protein